MNPSMSKDANYLQDRVEEQLKFYSMRSSQNKKYYLKTQKLIIALGVLIPIINFVALIFHYDYTYPFFLLISAIISSIIGFTAAISQLNKYYENWINYRITLELLKREKYLFQNNAGGYFNLNDIET